MREGAALVALFIFALAHATPYEYLSYANISATLRELSAAHPHLLTVYSAQQRFALPAVGRCRSLAENGTLSTAPCQIWIAELTERKTLVSDEMMRPEMLVSGEVHGDEVVGPHTTLAFIRYMIDKYNAGDAYARLMLASRVLTLIPTTNAIGYELEVREEIQDEHQGAKASHLHVGMHGEHGQHAERHVHYDPNRDFAFDNHPLSCMRTVTARVLNELMRRHMFQILITFHGGTNAIGYEWGDTVHCNGKDCSPAPDLDIMRRLALRMRDAAGPAADHEPEYPVGDMGKLVYSVHGGLEDWAYGASWSGQAVVCDPKSLGGYPAERTKYVDAMTRTVTYLVETSLSKRPPASTLGGDSNPMVRGAADDGHVPRNMRLIAAALDALQPYVQIEERGKVPFSAATDHAVNFTWRVGGAFVVDGTYLQWGTKSGRDGVSPVLRGAAGPNGTLFAAAVPFNTADVPASDTLYVRAAAVADNSLDRKADGAFPSVLPQSHLLAARARGAWKHRLGGNVVMARRVYYSRTLRVESFESSLRVTVDNGVRWGVGTGRIPSPTNSAVLRHLYPHARHFSGIFDGPLGQLRHMPPKSWGWFALVVLLWSLPCWVFYRNRCCSKRREGEGVGEDDLENKEPLIDEDVLS